MESKHILKSKTFWVNGVALVASIATMFGLDLGLDGEAQASIVGGIMAVVNIALRLTTKQPITLK